jgi:hypothetical protein
MTVIKIAGKAKTVFAVLNFMAEKAGELTVGEIMRLKANK